MLPSHSLWGVPIGPQRPLPIEDPRRLAGALEHLGERERRIVELRYGLGGRRHSLKEVGELLGISAGRVRQIETGALHKLSEYR